LVSIHHTDDHFVVVDGVTTAAASVDVVADVVFTSLLFMEQQDEAELAFLAFTEAVFVVVQASALASVVAQWSVDFVEAFVAEAVDVVAQQDDLAFFAEALSSHLVPAEARAKDDAATRAVIANMRMFMGRSPGSMVKVGSMSEWPEK
jgi:hypothetical protein